MPIFSKKLDNLKRFLEETDSGTGESTSTNETQEGEKPSTENNKTNEIDSPGFQYRPNSKIKVSLWPSLCQTKYHGSHWGKTDGIYSYWTRGSKSYLCHTLNKRDDLNPIKFDEDQNVSPCPLLIAEDSRGIKWAPVIVITTFGEIPGKTRHFEDSGKTRPKGVFSYMGKSYQGPIKAWLC